MSARGIPPATRALRSSSMSTGLAVEYSTSRPPRNSRPKLTPDTKSPLRATVTATTETTIHRLHCPNRSGPLVFSHCWNERPNVKPMTPGRSRNQADRVRISSMTRVTTSAENIDTMTPTVRVMPKPRTAPDARENRTIAAMRVVMLASTIALQARENPAANESTTDEPSAFSSFARS